MSAVALLPSNSLRSGRYQVMPPLPAEVRERLKSSIEARGVRYPILVTPELDIVDGHHRWEIAQELGITAEVPIKVIDVVDADGAEAEAISLNLDRNWLTREQRNKLILRLRELGRTQQEVADEVGLSQRRVGQIEEEDQALEETSKLQQPSVDEIIQALKNSPPRKPGQRLSKAQSEAVGAKVRELSERGYSHIEIAAEVGITGSAVGQRIAALRARLEAAEATPLHERLAECAAQGMTSRQISKMIGRGEQWVRDKAREHGIDIPADRASYRKSIDADASMSRAVTHLEDALYAFQMIPTADLDPELVDGWADSLKAAVKDIQTHIRNLNKHKKEQAQP